MFSKRKVDKLLSCSKKKKSGKKLTTVFPFGFGIEQVKP
jgi:hypothetical protein